MPLYSTPEFPEDGPMRDERKTALKTAIDYLKTEAACLGLRRVVVALKRAIIALEQTPPPPDRLDS